jgi:hypothetical protein
MEAVTSAHDRSDAWRAGQSTAGPGSTRGATAQTRRRERARVRALNRPLDCKGVGGGGADAL